MEYKCEFCGKICKNKNSLTQHSIRCSSNPNKIKTKHSNETRKKLSKIMKDVNTNSNRIWKTESIEKIKKSSKDFNDKYWTKEKRKEHSNLMKEIVKNNPESYSVNNISGRVKLYTHNGIKLKGTWEVMVAKSFDKCNIKWTNKIKPIPYIWNNSWHLYFPDFYLPEYDKYIEVKGYKRDRDIEKWKALDNLIIIKKYEINSIKKDYNNIKKLL